MATPRLLRRPLAVFSVVGVVSTFGFAAIESTPPAAGAPKVHETTVALPDGALGGAVTLPVQVKGGPELIAFTWKSAGPATFEVRAHDRAGWSKWFTLDGGDGDEAPDANSGEGSSTGYAGPAFLGRDIGSIEVRSPSGSDTDLGAVHGLVVHAIDSEVANTDGVASAASAPPFIIPRSQWGADESWRDDSGGECDGTPDYSDDIKMAVVHHTASRNDYTSAESAAIIRGIYDFHVHTNHWCDVAYSFFVDRFGQIFEGRYGGVERTAIGGHTSGFNTVATGVAVIGDFTQTAVPAAAYDSLVQILAWKLGYHGVNPQGSSTVTVGSTTSAKWPEGTVVTLPNIEGHGDSNKTSCPGVYLENMLPQLRTDVANVISQKGYVPAFSLGRLSGADRFGTASAIARATFGSAGTAFVARADDFADALSANYLAGHSAAPILLANPTNVPQPTLDALKSLGVGTVHLLGGTAALGPDVETALRNAGFAVDRIAGADRYATAAAVAGAGASGVGLDGGLRKTAVVSSGTSFPDALAAGGIVYARHFPQLLASPTGLPAATAAALTNLGIQHVILTGGTGALSTAVEDQIKGMGIATDRVAGASRYETSVALADLSVDYLGFSPTNIVVATGQNFPDALAGGPYAGKGNAPLVLTLPSQVPGSVCDFLRRRGGATTAGQIFGGSGAVDGTAKYGLQECIQPPP
jgi:putative cell wall-binding protein